LRNSNTCPEARFGYSVPRWLLAWLAAACSVTPALALDPNRSISQYIHDEWGIAQGLPAGTIYAIAQSADGYLWIGAEKGLVRFDGLSFQSFSSANFPSLPPGPVIGLLADREGNLWIRPQGPTLVRYRDGTFQEFRVIPEQSDYSVTAMGRGSAGELLLSYRNAVAKYSAGKVLPLLSGKEVPLVISVAQTADGHLWLGTRDAGLLSESGGHVSAAGFTLHDSKINALLPSGDRELWIATDNGVLRWDGTGITRSGVPASLARVQTFALIKDRESNIWAGTANGLVRVRAASTLTPDQLARPGQEVTALFEDREGDLWVGSARGLERFRYSLFVTYSPPLGRAEGNGPIYVDEQRRAWFGPSQGGLSRIEDGEIKQISSAGLDKDVVYSIAGAPGELWIARQLGGLTCLRFKGDAVTSKTYTKADGLAQNSVYAVYRSRSGAVWAGTVNGGVSKFQDGRFTTYTTANGLAADTVSAIEETPDGAIWLATPNGLNKFSDGRWIVLSGADGLPPGGVNCLTTDASGLLWIGTSKGLAVLRGRRVEFPAEAPELLREEIFGIAEDRSGWLWIATSNRVLRVNRVPVLSGAVRDSDVREYGTADGLLGTEGAKRFRSVVADSLGRLWFSLNRGISVVDPALLLHPPTPVLVHIEKISVDGRVFQPRPALQFPYTPRRITIGYAGLSLAVPERIRFRYQLEGYDHDWSEPTAEREAPYTNLTHGPYRFRVIASNSGGVWDSAEAVATFEIAPALWQTWWFRLIVVLGCVFSVLMLYRFRLHQMTRRIMIRFEERLAERTRIAQDLHDTLLQGFLSASMQLSVALDGLPADSPAKPPLTHILQLMRQVTEEGRNRVRGLRSSTSASVDLAKALAEVRNEIHVPGIAFRVIVQGEPQPLHPMLGDEVYRIGREALVNAFRHSHAKNIEVELEYTPARLRVLVRDDGCGIDPQVLKSGREGHWGLVGMRERAEQIGAKLSVWSRATAGTEIELSVPGNIAFPVASRNWLRRGLAWILPLRGKHPG
jgi:signal transduction histidine kinase/ligand-binding sensor domain-containing protein